MFHQKIWIEHDRSAVANEDPMTQIRRELWTMQANLETLRTRVGDVEGRRDLIGLHEGQQVLATRISQVEECISAHHVLEFMRRIMQTESRIGNIGGIIGDTLRHCLMRLDQCTADLEDLRDRVREQEWYHGLSEQESDDEIQRILARTEGQDTGAENRRSAENRPINRDRRRPRMTAQQRRAPSVMNGRAPRVLPPQEDVQMPEVHEDTLQQRLQRLTASQRQNAESLNQVNSRIDQLRHDFWEATVESTLAIQSVMQQVRGQGQGVERLRHVFFQHRDGQTGRNRFSFPESRRGHASGSDRD